MGYNRDFRYWPQSKQSVQESQFELVPAQNTEHKVTKKQCLVLCKQIQLSFFGANREFKRENIVQAYPVVVDTFKYK